VLLRATEERETRILSLVGLGVAVLLVVACVSTFAWKSLARQPSDLVRFTLDTPYVGQGVASGTSLIIHGAKVGQVTSVANRSGAVRINAELQAQVAKGLTDTLNVDFRPASYFGVTAINLLPGSGGTPLRNGAMIKVEPKGNFALQALLSRLGEISNGVINQQLISVIDRATRYTDGLNPLLETMVMVTSAVTKVQTVSTEQLLRNTTGIAVALPGFLDAAVELGDDYLHNYIVDFSVEEAIKANPFFPKYDDHLREVFLANARLLESDPDEFMKQVYVPYLEVSGDAVFGSVGRLESTHVIDLKPAVGIVQSLADVVPALANPAGVAATTKELRARLERMFAGSPEQRALQLRIVLDELPGVAAPVEAIGGATP
jgi:hypothetical protein